MAKRITQETFDEAVKDNVEEFDMSLPEAIADAVKLFSEQGIVNLDDIDTTGGVGREEIVAVIDEVIRLSRDSLSIPDAIESAVRSLHVLCDDKNEMSKRNQMLIMSSGGLTALYTVLQTRREIDVVRSTMILLTHLSKCRGVI